MIKVLVDSSFNQLLEYFVLVEILYYKIKVFSIIHVLYVLLS